MTTQRKIFGKIKISGKLTLVTGLHIGSSKDFAPIGAVDSVVVRDPLTNRPIIPGSSLKGKLRTLLVKAIDERETGDNSLVGIKEDLPEIKRLFGASEPEIISSRLQFYDLFVDKDSVEKLRDKTDLYLTEIKFENTINRTDSVANPRQLERVPAGANFAFQLIYNVEVQGEVEADFANLAIALKFFHLDYLGGSGTRGYGKVKVAGLKVELLDLQNLTKPTEIDVVKLQSILEESEKYALSL
ncbi:CRISPR-associated protein Csm3 [Candidatus Termititenax persephonae]|uniref:CRISPR system Cms endoribonuclease Csm3 n=1 Tax=Candidatus Termititenax persephonae TaxID=2218525 RepID=A0A388TGH0_9BACT|nr:CRISPR-associated protein Csm3 [Candidatus Termititenax persephonae]